MLSFKRFVTSLSHAEGGPQVTLNKKTNKRPRYFYIHYIWRHTGGHKIGLHDALKMLVVQPRFQYFLMPELNRRSFSQRRNDRENHQNSNMRNFVGNCNRKSLADELQNILDAYWQTYRTKLE